MLNLSHADSNDLSSLHNPISPQGVLEGSPQRLSPAAHPALWASPGQLDQSALCPADQALLHNQTRSSSLVRGPSTERQLSQRELRDYARSFAGASAYSQRGSHDLTPAASHELRRQRQSGDFGYRSSKSDAPPAQHRRSCDMTRVMSQDQTSRQHASWRSTVCPHSDEEDNKLQHR